ncbi:hypothetical protein BJG92_03470 [Arthrobacter sp. SO5]|uniref:hypothetical protein n=1 Tax=Arthrobacter sp. SO5 TaxID=1897055 RepID=UPI001E340871|nr:hypothetical protein [Arthrobacter sp. SO5]MCB5275916.1 hypothetical protein [Arthrobacter sp. SO5]
MHEYFQYIQGMCPLDGSTPDDFSGVDFATYVCAAQIYDERKVEDQVSKVVEDFFETRGLPARRCSIDGLGAAAGGGSWMDLYMWVKENWDFLQPIASAFIGFAIGVTTKWKNFRRRLDNKVLDRHMPSIVLEIGARTKGTDVNASGENSRSLNSLLRLVPALDEALRDQLPDQKFSIRVVSLSENDPSRLALFKVERITKADIARVMRYFKKIENDPDTYAISLHRQLGFIPRLRRNHGVSAYGSLIRGSTTNPE